MNTPIDWTDELSSVLRRDLAESDGRSAVVGPMPARARVSLPYMDTDGVSVDSYEVSWDDEAQAYAGWSECE